MIHELVLTAPVPAERLECGNVGTVVHVYADGKAFELDPVQQLASQRWGRNGHAALSDLV